MLLLLLLLGVCGVIAILLLFAVRCTDLTENPDKPYAALPRLRSLVGFTRYTSK